MHSPSLSKLLRRKQKGISGHKNAVEKKIPDLQLEMLHIQQGIFHGNGRVVIVFEGFDAAGKGGAIRTLTSTLDPRGITVHPIGPPLPEERGEHYLQRFWRALPAPGTIAVFDRSWYGRVLVEKVEGLTKSSRIRDAYREINEFETLLTNDGISVLKFFLGVSREEQLRRFEDRLKDPYKQWKLTADDIRSHVHWDAYVKAADKMFAKTHNRNSPWHLIPADHKSLARLEIMRICVKELSEWREWIREKAARLGTRTLEQELARLGRKDGEL
jgi:polyphosphate kinase 2 (PPK2 family)